MFAGKAGTYLRGEYVKGATLGEAPSLTHKHQTRLESLVKENTLVYKENEYITDVNSFITLVPGLEGPLSLLQYEVALLSTNIFFCVQSFYFHLSVHVIESNKDNIQNQCILSFSSTLHFW
jgi:hypothetical protein